MAPFANITAAELKKGDIIMFAMGSSSPGRVAPRADRCLGGQCWKKGERAPSLTPNVRPNLTGLDTACLLIDRYRWAIDPP